MARLRFLVWLIATVSSVQAASPYSLTWSDKSYGPNGPWRAVTVAIGSKKQKLDLNPGARWASLVLSSSICSNTSLSSTCYAEDAGVFEADDSTSLTNNTKPGWGSWYWDVQGSAQYNYVSDTYSLSDDGPTVPNVSMTAMYNGYDTYPDGKHYPVSIGTLSLGAPDLRFRQESYNMTYVPSYLYTTDQIPSYSYGMHIGSAALDIPGSLLFGGFDKNRILGDVSSQAYDSGKLSINLQDIGIGVADGQSPFSFQNKSKLLSEGSSSLNPPIPMEINPIRPYLYLPRSACDAIANELPVSFNQDLGLYFWNTSDASYEKIISSPAYLSFTFQKNSNDWENLNIKVPFSLLNLTLEAPLVDTPASYFPCSPTTDNRNPVLGKAFLQAAFVGVNWGTGNGNGNWFLAQAPGPGLDTSQSITTIEVQDSTITGSENTWEKSWADHWTPITNGTSNNSDGDDSSGLSTGAKAGIGVGAGVGGLAVISALIWLFLRRRRNTHAHTPVPESPTTKTNPYPLVGTAEVPRERMQELQELGVKDGVRRPVEAPATPARPSPEGRYELD